MTYAVLWRTGHGPARAGKLSLLERSLVLEGGSNGSAGHCELAYADINSVGIERAAAERLAGRPVAVIEPATGDTVSVAILGGAGLLPELVDRLDTVTRSSAAS
jgi:hypothetical protein